MNLKNRTTVICTTIVLMVLGAAANATLIDFEGTGAPSVFIGTTHLTELYAPLGVHFSGPGRLDGGAILNQDGNFGVNALSGTDFLAFNNTAVMSDGGIPTDPEKILFDNPMGYVSIFAAGGFNADYFLLSAYDAGGSLLGSSNVTTQGWAQLSYSDPTGSIKWIILQQQGDYAYVYDNLEFDVVPEPGSLMALASGLVVLGGIIRRRR